MNSQNQVTTINVMGRQFTIRCPAAEVSALHNSVRYLNQKISDFADNNQLANIEEVLIVTALNIIQEMSQQNAQLEDYIHNLNKRVHKLQDKVDDVLTHQKEMEL